MDKAMEVTFRDAALDTLESDANATGGWPHAIVKSYRKKMQAIRAASDERTFRQMKSLHFEKLQPPRSHQHSMRLNDQWRLVLEFSGESPNKKVVIVAIEDYH
jgi:toxin HigB-1